MVFLRTTIADRIVIRSLSGLRPHHNVRDVITPRTKGGKRVEPKRVTLNEAVRNVKSGDWIYLHHAASTPVDLVNALAERAIAEDLKDIRVTHALLLGNLPFDKNPNVLNHIRPVSYFVSTPIRNAVNAGKADYIPIFLNETGRIYDEKRLPVDVAFLNLSPPDEHGYCTLGVDVDMSSAATRNAKTIIATINKTQPKTFGDSQIHISHIDYLVAETPTPICALDAPVIKPVEQQIGKLIAENLVPNEATLQLGIGSIPDAILNLLGNHKDLGIHSEMISDGVVDLMESGVITNAKKSMHKFKTVMAFAMGSRKLYDMIDNNPNFLFGSVGFTNSVETIMAQHRMISINSAIEVDITGQICSDTIGQKFFSGFGGQVDFVYGSAAATDGLGCSIMALPSRTEKGQSKIVPFLREGSGVVTTRAHARYVVTEYGIASLWSKPILERAYELINIAHPDDREALEKGAFKRFGSMPIKSTRV